MSHQVVDDLTTITGWTSSDPVNAAISKEDGNLKIALTGANANGNMVGKTFSDIDVSTYPLIRIRIKSDRLANGISHLDKEGQAATIYPFYLDVILGNNSSILGTWSIPIRSVGWHEVAEIALAGINTIDEIVFTFKSLTKAVTVYIDEILVVNEEIETDILEAIKTALNDKVTFTAYNLSAGVSAGGTLINPTNYSNLYEGCIIEIAEGSTKEKHQVETVLSGEKVTFNEMTVEGLSGKTLVNSFTTLATVRVVVPAVIFDDLVPEWLPDRTTPIIVITDVSDATDIGKVFSTSVFDSYKSDGTIQKRFPPVGLNLDIQIAVESRLMSHHRLATKAVKDWLRYNGRLLRVAGHDYAVVAEPEHVQEKGFLGSNRIRTIFPIQVMAYQEIDSRITDYATTSTAPTLAEIKSVSQIYKGD